jgi:acetylornithine/succinyldiaminopimelate/putrescine aminotransferase
VHLPFGDHEALRAAMARPDVAAVIVEPVQGEGGIRPLPDACLKGLRDLCDETGALLIFDEVQCGLGRTGHLRGWDAIAPDIKPDGVSWAKGIANGFPLGSFWASSERSDSRGPLCDLLGPGSHGTTYGGNPVACAAGLTVLDVIQRERLLENAATMGVLLADSLRAIKSPWIEEVRAVGLMVGFQLSAPVTPFSKPIALEAVTRAMGEGMLVIPAGETVVRFLPPLNTTRSEITEAAEKFQTVLNSLPASPDSQSNQP